MNSVLSKVKVNDLVEINYGERDGITRLCRVVKVRDLKEHPLAQKTLRSNPKLQRSDKLVTLMDSGGRISSCYAGMEHSCKKIGILQKLFLRFVPKKV